MKFYNVFLKIVEILDKSKSIILSLFLLILIIVIGYVIEKLLLIQLKKFQNKTKINKYFNLSESLKGIIFSLFIILSLYLSVIFLNLNKNISHYIYKIIIISIVLIVTIYIERIISNILNNYWINKNNLQSNSIISNSLKIIIYIIGILIGFQSIGISVIPILTALGVGGLAIALALQDTLSNLFAGIQIVASKHIKNGDYIKINTGEEGFVVDINWRNTIIKTLTNNIIIIPNSKIASSIITDFYKPNKNIFFTINLCVNYNCDLEKVEKIICDIAYNTLKNFKVNLDDFKPLVRFFEFGEYV